MNIENISECDGKDDAKADAASLDKIPSGPWIFNETLSNKNKETMKRNQCFYEAFWQVCLVLKLMKSAW